jgi:hypothetical protein
LGGRKFGPCGAFAHRFPGFGGPCQKFGGRFPGFCGPTQRFAGQFSGFGGPCQRFGPCGGLSRRLPGFGFRGWTPFNGPCGGGWNGYGSQWPRFGSGFGFGLRHKFGSRQPCWSGIANPYAPWQGYGWGVPTRGWQSPGFGVGPCRSGWGKRHSC